MTGLLELFRRIGSSSSTVVMECRKCGRNRNDDATECPNCGSTRVASYELE